MSGNAGRPAWRERAETQRAAMILPAGRIDPFSGRWNVGPASPQAGPLRHFEQLVLLLGQIESLFQRTGGAAAVAGIE
jgi:hypothetical protein